MNYNQNGVIEFLKQQIKDFNIREEQWQHEKTEYQKKNQELEQELDELKIINCKLMEQIKSIQFAFQPITENIKKSTKTSKIGHHRVKSDMDHKYQTFQSSQPLINNINQSNDKKKDKNDKNEKKPILFSFLKELETEDLGLSVTQYLSSPSLNIQIQPSQSQKISQILINQTNYTTFNTMQSSFLSPNPNNQSAIKQPFFFHHHQRSNSNGVGKTQAKQQTKLNNQQLFQSISERQMVVGLNLFELQGQLSSHFDGVRSIALNDQFLVSGSEDCTLKVWDARKFSQNIVSCHYEPLHTIRQSLGSIMTLTAQETSIKNEKYFQVYSAGVDGMIMSHLLPITKEWIESENKSDISSICWQGHKDVIWQLKHHPFESRLLSVSSDSSIKMWKPYEVQMGADYFFSNSKNNEYQTKAAGSFINKNYYNVPQIPTSVDWILNDSHQQIIAGYCDSQQFTVFDVEQFRLVAQFKYQTDQISKKNDQTNKILFHNDKKVSISGHNDNKIRFCDIRSKKIIKSLIGHTDSVTDIIIIPMNCEQIASVSHDGSMRTWDIRKFQCLHEIPTHKRKYDESVHVVAANKQVVATGGADGMVKLFKLQEQK